MSFFGVELNAQVNKLILAIRLSLAQNRYIPNFRTIYRSFANFDVQQTGWVPIGCFEKVLNTNKIFMKKFEIQVFHKCFTEKSKFNWFGFMGLLRHQISDKCSKIIENVFDAMDSAKNGQIHYSQLIQKFNPEQIRQYQLGLKDKDTIGKQLLNLVPLTPEGFITKQQFINFYTDLSLNMLSNNAYARFICSQWNYPYIAASEPTIEEIKSALRIIRFKLIQRTEGTHQQFLLKQVFDEFDVDHNEVLDESQLLTMLIKLQIPTESQLVKPLLQKLDHNHSGTVDYDQFKNFIFFDPYPI